MKITVLRLGHRIDRDKRISTHVGLVARAFGAERIIFTGEKDEKLFSGLRKVAENWGGEFEVEYEKSWKKAIWGFGGATVHLTMYGEPVQKSIKKIASKSKRMLVIVGGEKVPSELYSMVDFNVGVTSQPHSEVSALAIFLDRVFEGAELEKKFDGRLKIVPKSKGKCVVSCRK